MGQEYLDSLDVANKVCQLLGVTQIASVTEVSKNNREISFAFGKVRRTELRRNPWVFAIRKAVLRPIDVNTMLLVPAQWSATTTYLSGAIVADANNQVWLSAQKDNLNNQPGGNTNAWDDYFGPKTIEPWDTTGTTTYYAGELVYMATFPGSYQIFMSLVNTNSDTPNVATTYDPTVTYYSDQVVSYSGALYKSTSEFNLGITPFDGSLILPFDPTATYGTGNQVTGSDNQIYTSVGSGNIGHGPTTDGGVHWTATSTTNAWVELPADSVVSSVNWLPLVATMKSPITIYPAGAGPSSQLSSKNIYHLPVGFLRRVPQDPEAGSSAFLGVPSWSPYDDWEMDGEFIVTSVTNNGPLVLRFIADVTKVALMDDMFCGGLACSIAAQVCEILTQSTAKLQTVASEYKIFMGEARTVNAIEGGPTEPPADVWITCRI
jgi:hypothetical protein